jgi:succinate dehydrogenase / fumarate reductase cytochrome b subunit
MNNILKTSIGRKILMALSAFFLMFFLLMHLTINLLSVFSEDAFNTASHFMGTNPLIQFAMQPVLILGVVFHFVMGFVLELKNRKSTAVKYVKNNGAANSTWMSRNMIISGAAILAFIAIHFIDFWIPELKYKYVDALAEQPTRYYEELVHKFHDIRRVAVYVIAFVFLALHLMHGFKSAFQSMGVSAMRKKAFETCGKIYAIGVPLGFIFVTLYHYFNH